MSFNHFLAVLRARWKIAALVLTFCLGLAMLANFLIPKRYVATAQVVVDLKTPDPISGQVVQSQLTPALMSTQVDVFKSTRVGERVVKALKLNEDPKLQSDWKKAPQAGITFDSWAASYLGLALDVQPSRESNVIKVSYKATNAALAAQVTNAYVKAYIETVLEMRTQPAKEYNEFFESHAKQLRENLEAANRKLSQFQQANGLLGVDERYDVETARLNELSSQVVAAQGAAAMSRSKNVNRGNDTTEVMNNSVVTTIRSELQRARTELNEASSRLGDAHPRIIDLKARIDGLEARLSEENARVSRSVATNHNVNASALAELRVEMDGQRAKLLRLKAQRDEAAVLQRDVENAQRSYDGVLERLNRTTMESQNALTNISVLSAAVVPSKPASPNTGLNLAIAGFLGALFGVLAAILRELMDSRVRGSDDIDRLTNLPVLIAIPSCGQGQYTRRLPTSRRTNMPQLGVNP